MPDYIQLLESKLSPNQKQALNAVTDVARTRGIPVFLTGGAVRDIISGASIRDLDITVQGNPLKFRKELEKAGFAITGDHEPSQTLYLRYGRRARLEISAARTESFPKPARPEYHPSSILGDLRRRDFTANAMALSLNEGSWGLLLDPLNGTADIYARQLRLVSNYGFLEDPVRLARAARLLARTGWEMEERTKVRYANAKSEGVINAISATQRGYELEEIVYEEEPLQALKALDSEGWLTHLSSNWNSKSADATGLEKLHERLVKLLMAGLHPDPSAAQFRLLTAKLSPANLSALKRLFVRKDLIEEADALDREAKKVLQQITAKTAAKPSQLWKLLHEVSPEAVLWLYFTGKGAAIQNKFENFFTKWPEARQKIPNALLQEMRIVPDTPGYEELLDKLTFAFMDNELPNDEAIRKLAEPYSPPLPPAPVVVRRSRAVKRVVEPKAKGKKAKKAAAEAAGAIVPAEPGTAEAAVAATASTPLTGKKAGAAKAESKAADATKKQEPAAKSKTAEKVAKEKSVAAQSGKTALAKAAQAKAKPTKSVVKSSASPSKKVVVAKGAAKKPAVKAKTVAKLKSTAKTVKKSVKPVQPAAKKPVNKTATKPKPGKTRSTKAKPVVKKKSR
jgi:tRNA nucleotidyltransferase/poly(A) polymerase